MSQLILKRASASRPSSQWCDDYDVLAHGAVVGRISLTPDMPENRQWLWTLAHDEHKDHGYETTRERARAAAMAAFAKSWGRQ